MIGFYDMHCHFLPGVDDGSKNMDMTIAMIKTAYAEGIRHIVCTPHYIVGHNKKDKEEILEIIKEVQKETKDLFEDEIKLYPGNELFYTEGIIADVISGKAMTINNSRYVLIEFSEQEAFNKISEACSAFTQKGYIPIIAHVERFTALYKNMDNIRKLINTGALIQVNCSSFEGGFFNDTAAICKRLVDNGLVHLLGTDAHREKGRAPLMQKSTNLIYKKFGLGVVKKIAVENAKNILQNKLIG